MNVTHVRRQSFYALPTQQRSILSQPPFSMLETFSRVDEAIATNANLAEAILETALESFGLIEGASGPWHGKSTKIDLDKVRSTIHQLYRDWSAEGDIERSACYAPVMQDLAERFSEELNGEEPVKVLVPGAGLGRLVYELCRLGMDVEGNEISYHQLLTSSFILNHTARTEEWSLHPWAFSFSNNLTRAAQLSRVLIPDVHPRSLVSKGSMNMTTGDFCVVYRDEEYENQFDAVVTVFFIDTAPNLMNYMETVKHCLKPGGLWSNLGPLLWHSWDKDSNHDHGKTDQVKHGESTEGSDAYLGIGEPGSVELCEDEVMALLETYGFRIEKHETTSATTGYVSNPASMLRSVYQPVHWTAIKL